MGSRILNVPYKSQYGVDAALKRSDCGPACIAMLLGAVGRTLPTHAITTASSMVGDSGLRPNQVVDAARALGLTLSFEAGCTLDALKRLIDNGQPPIALIQYSKIPDRWDQSYTAGYFVVVVGYDDATHRVFINDPGYPPGAMGYQRPYLYQMFLNAWETAEPAQNHTFCLIVPQPAVPVAGTLLAAPPADMSAPQPNLSPRPTAPPARSRDIWVVAPLGLALRQQPNVSAKPVAHLVFGQHLIALANEPDSDTTSSPWRQVCTDAGAIGWVTANLDGAVLLSQAQPNTPRLVQVRDEQAVREAGGLSLREKRDINITPLERLQISERLIVYDSVVAANGTTWLLAQSPRGQPGWVREQVGSVTLVGKINPKSVAALDTSTPMPAPGVLELTPPPAASGDVWVIAPAGLALRTSADPSAQRIAGLSFGQRLTALGAESAPDTMRRTWQQVRADSGSVGFVVASFQADRYLSSKRPPPPFTVQVLDTQPVRDSRGLDLYDRRDAAVAAIERVPIGESLIVYDRVTETDGAIWLWVRSPRGQFGWVREQRDGTLLVSPVEAGPDALGATGPTVDVRPFGKCLSGLGMGNPQPLTLGQLRLVAQSKIEAFKMLALPHPDDNTRLIQRLRDIASIKFIAARLFFAVDASSKFRFSPQMFVDTVFSGANAAYQSGVRYFEVHNEPNLESEGMGWNWTSGADFGAWLTQAIAILRQRLPEGKFGFPGLSPQPNVPAFLDGATPAIHRCDWIGIHCYWQSSDQGQFPMTGVEAGMYWRGFRDRFPRKLLMITEFSNNSARVDPVEKGRQYARYYQLLRHEPNLGAAFAFALSWPGQDANGEGWEVDGRETAIPGTLGALIERPEFLA